MNQTLEDAEITPIAQLILDENITALEAELNAGWNIHLPLQFARYDLVAPITFACTNDKAKVIAWLIHKNAGRNKNMLHDKKLPAIIAAGYGRKGTITLLLDNGANINATDRLHRNIITMALYAKKLEWIPFLLERGFDVKKDGRSLRQAVYSRQHKAVQMLLNAGFDVNFHERDQVHPENPSAVHVAASNTNDFKTLKLLIEYGADITRKDTYGDRPFNAALGNNDKALMAYLKAMEPAEWHDEDLHLASLAKYNLPASLIKICQSKRRKITVCKEKTPYGVRWVVLHPVLMLKAATFRKKEFVEIVADTDNYDNFLVWYPAKNCLAYMDYEHDEFKVLGKWEDFLSNPDAFFSKYLSKYF
jgi:uncharacterized protein